MKHNVLFRPSSVLSGLIVVAVLIILSGMRPLGTPDGQTVYFNQTAAYIVPANTELIIGALGLAFERIDDYTDQSAFIRVSFDGLAVLVVTGDQEGPVGPALREIPVGLVAGAGTEVTVSVLTFMSGESRLAAVAMGHLNNTGP